MDNASPEKALVLLKTPTNTVVFLATRRILSTMLKRSSLLDDEIQRFGCRALASLSKNTAAGAKGVLDAGGPRALVHAMRAHPRNPEVQSEACVLVINLTKHNAAAASTVREYGATQPIVDALTTHKTVSDVLVWASAALGFLALHDASGAAAVIAADGHSAVAQVMLGPSRQTMPADADVLPVIQQWGAALLSNIARHGTAYASAVAAAGGAKAVCAAMRAQPDDASMQRDGALTLVNLAKIDAQSAHAVTAAGGAELLVMALRAVIGGDSKEPTWVYVSGLGHLAKHSAATAEAVAEAGALDSIVEAMRAYPEVLLMQSWGCIAICNLAKHLSFRSERRVVKGAQAAIESALVMHSGDQVVVRWGGGALKRLQRHERAKVEAAADDASWAGSPRGKRASIQSLRTALGGLSSRETSMTISSTSSSSSSSSTQRGSSARRAVGLRADASRPVFSTVSEGSDAGTDSPVYKKSSSSSKSGNSRRSSREVSSQSV